MADEKPSLEELELWIKEQELKLRKTEVRAKGGWKKDHCYICQWELSETQDTDHGAGDTNGRDWLCTECYKKFCERPDFFSSSYSDIT